MGKRKGLAFLAVAVGATTAILLQKRKHRHQETPKEKPEEKASEDIAPPQSSQESEDIPPIP